MITDLQSGLVEPTALAVVPAIANDRQSLPNPTLVCGQCQEFHQPDIYVHLAPDRGVCPVWGCQKNVSEPACFLGNFDVPF